MAVCVWGMSRYDNRPWRHLYKTAAWKVLRDHHKRIEPVCRYCLQQGQPVAVQVVDHIIPHRGDEALFFDPNNLQSLCKLHHDSTKQREERTGQALGCDASGIPLDPGHHWHR